MTGIVIVSHSSKIAEGVCELAGQMAPGFSAMIPVGGLEDGTLGTDPVRIMEAIRSVDQGDGVVLLADLGSGIMSAEAAMELLEGEIPVWIADAPLVEGAVVAVVEASAGAAPEEVVRAAESARGEKKL